VLAGAYLFGGVTLAQFQAQALGVEIPSQYCRCSRMCDDSRTRDHLPRCHRSSA
jgi:hypothetical protein